MKHKLPISYGWLVLFACACIQFYFSSTFFNAFTVFFNPIASEFNWSYAIVSMAMTFRGLEIGFLSPVVGFFVDRFGTRKLLIVSTLLGAAGFFLFSHINSVWTYFLACIILGTAVSLNSTVVVVPAIIKWFAKRPSLAIGILISGSAASGLLVPKIVSLVDTAGWRDTFTIFAISALVFCLPLCFLVKDPPPADIVNRDKSEKHQKTLPFKRVIRDVIRQKNFWLLSLALFFAGFVPATMSAHQMPYLTSIGISRTTSGWLIMIFLLAGLIGRPLLGWAGDVFDKRYIFTVAVLLQTIGIGGFSYSNNLFVIIPSLIGMGIGTGGIVALRNAIQLDFFGKERYGTIQGLLVVFVTLGSMIAPPLAGWIYDSYQTYHPAWIMITICSFMAVPLILFSSIPRRRESVDSKIV